MLPAGGIWHVLITAGASGRTAELSCLVLRPDFANGVSMTETSYQGLASTEVTVRPLPVLGLVGRRESLE